MPLLVAVKTFTPVQNQFLETMRILLMIVAGLLLMSCTKDRVIDRAPIVLEDGNVVLHYWNFNDNTSSAMLLQPSIVFEEASLRVVADSVDATNSGDGTALNAMDGTASGRALRVRNRSQWIDINFSTINHGNIKLSTAFMRSNNGPKSLFVSYSNDGNNFISQGLTEVSYDISEDWMLLEVDFSHIPLATNNPLFTVRFTFQDGNEGTSGNSRFDNLLITGSRISN